MAPPGTPIVYGIANCDTVRRARAWLVEHGIEARFHDLAKSGVPADRLDAWIDVLGWEIVLNRRGTTWRTKVGEPERTAVVDAPTAARLLVAQPSLVKRPVVEWPDGEISVGFDPQAWAKR